MEYFKKQYILTNEADTVDQFNAHFKQYPDENIAFPTIIDSSETMMIQTYCEGVPYSKFKALYPNDHLLARIKTIAAVLEMAFIIGIVNVDCHDGNVLYKKSLIKSEPTTITFIDNGMTIRFSQHERSVLVNIAVAFIKLDASQFIHALMHFVKTSDIGEVMNMYEQINKIFSLQTLLPDMVMLNRLILVLKSHMHLLDYRLLCCIHQLVQFDKTVHVDKDKNCSFADSLKMTTTNIYSLTLLYIYFQSPYAALRKQFKGLFERLLYIFR